MNTMRALPRFLSLALLGTIVPRAQGASFNVSLCDAWLKKIAGTGESDLLELKKRYLIHVNGESQVRDLQLTKVEPATSAHATIYEFAASDGTRSSPVRLEAGKFFAYQYTPPFSLWQSLHPRRLGNNAESNIVFAWRALAPDHRSLHQTPTLNITSVRNASPVTQAHADALVEHITAFDARLKQNGWATPPRTRIHLAERSFAPQGAPAYAVPRLRTPSAPSGQSAQIHIAPSAPDALGAAGGLYDVSIALHERAHTVMTENYALSAFVNEHTPFSEAVSDYLAADHSGNPLYGGEIWNQEFGYRDIKNRAVQIGPQTATKLNDISQILPASQPAAGHENSVFYSQVLWSLRMRLGPTRARALLKSVIESSNQSWTEFRNRPTFINLSPHNREIKAFEFFLANVARVGAETRIGEVQKIIDALAIELKLNSNEIRATQNSLVRDGQRWTPNLTDSLKAHAYVYGVAATPLVAAAATVIGPPLVYYYLMAEPELPESDDESNETPATTSPAQTQ